MSICIISPEASRDLDEIFEYFASRNVEVGEIEPSLRGVTLDNYIIFHRSSDRGIKIVRVVRGYRNIESLFVEKEH